MSERLHKVLAQHGIGSRREVERWIAEGRIQINGVTAKAGDRYEAGDRVQLDGREVGKRLEFSATPQVLAYHKPQGQPIERESAPRVAQEGEHAQDTFAESAEERLPTQRGSRWLPINPMHPGDSGLLLFTNDGKLSYALTRQKKKIPTTYMVRVHVRGGAAAAPELPTALKLDDGTVEFTEVSVSTAPEADNESGNVWYKVEMPRADKRAAVRALFVSHGLTVSRMMQVAFGGIALTKEMPRARHVALKPAQVAGLYALAQLAAPVITQNFANKQKSKAVGGAKQTRSAAEATFERPRRAPRQRAELRRAPGGGSNRPSRPGARVARKK